MTTEETYWIHALTEEERRNLTPEQLLTWERDVEAEAEAIFGIPNHSEIGQAELTQEKPQAKSAEDKKTKESTYKTPPTVLKAIRKYEDNIKQDKELLEKRNHQKNYSGAKSFITYAAKIDELHEMKTLIDEVLKWSKDVENFDQLKRSDRKEAYRQK